VKKLLIGGAALLIVAACSQEAEQPAAEEPATPVSGIDTAGMDTSVRPGDDFFAYVNGTWVKETEMPADKARYGVFDKLRDESQEAVKAIIEQSATGDFAKGTDEQKVGDLYNSYLDWDTRNAKGIEPLQAELDRINAISSHDDLAVYFAEATKRALDAPFGVGQLPDPKDPQRYAIVAGQSGLGLPDREYYLKDDEKSEDIRNKYVAHVAKMFDLAGLPDGAAAADTIMALETRIATEHMTKEQSRRYLENYSEVELADLPALMPNFNWDGFLAALEISNVPFIGVFTMDYLKALDGIITDTDLDTWKSYLTWSALNNTAGRLTKDSTGRCCPEPRSSAKTGAARRTSLMRPSARLSARCM
jgi:putative endopeptidase